MSININDPLGDVASAIDVFKKETGERDPQIYITEDCPFYKDIIKHLDYEGAPTIIVIKSCAVGRSEYINVGTPGYIDIMLQGIVRNVMIEGKFDTYDTDPTPLVKSDNKPWYQDRKHFKNKKSRRKL